MLNAADTPMVKMSRLRTALGVSDETIRRWRQARKLPPADVDLGGPSVWWHEATLERAGIRLSASPDPAAANPPTPAAS